EMAYGMAKWAKANWRIKSRDDLDDYTYYVAGLVGVMLSKLWDVCANVKTDRDLAIGYGRGLQAVNILRNEEEDLEERDVSFVRDVENYVDIIAYAKEKLAKDDEYMKARNKSTI